MVLKEPAGREVWELRRESTLEMVTGSHEAGGSQGEDEGPRPGARWGE